MRKYHKWCKEEDKKDTRRCGKCKYSNSWPKGEAVMLHSIICNMYANTRAFGPCSK